MKIGKIIKKIIIGIFGVAFFGFAIAIAMLLLNYNKYGVTQIDDISVIIIKKGMSSDDFNKGDVALVRKEKVEDLKVGDEVFAYKVAEDGSVSINYGTIGETHPNDDAITFENGNDYDMDFVIGKTEKVYEKVGTYLAIIESKWVFFGIILVPSFIILIYEIYALIVEIKYGKDE